MLTWRTWVIENPALSNNGFIYIILLCSALKDINHGLSKSSQLTILEPLNFYVICIPFVDEKQDLDWYVLPLFLTFGPIESSAVLINTVVFYGSMWDKLTNELHSNRHLFRTVISRKHFTTPLQSTTQSDSYSFHSSFLSHVFNK